MLRSNTDWCEQNNQLSRQVVERGLLGELLSRLGCKVSDGREQHRLPCPIHQGRGRNFLIRPCPKPLYLHWRCTSRPECNAKYRGSLLGLVRGVLEAEKGKTVDMWTATEYVKRFLEEDHDTKLSAYPNYPNESNYAIPIAAARSRLQIPAPFFVERGYDPAILDQFHVGYSTRLGAAVVPFLSDDGQTVIGLNVRSRRPRCKKCGSHHFPDAGCDFAEPKWCIEPKGFRKGHYLYGYHHAEKTTGPILLVEGPGDVWRAAEAGLTAIALLGVSITDTQAIKLHRLARPIAIVLDIDDAGRSGAIAVEKELRAIRVDAKVLQLPDAFKDVGAMPASELASWFARH
jgi:hypothetical protein